MTIEALRTPDDRFDSLPDYAFEPHYIDDLPGYPSLRVHYLDEGDRQAEHAFLCLHGQPTWSYLYRKMIPVFAAAGARVIAPDWLGFGRSDKPVDDKCYTFSFHRQMMMAFIERLDLRNITLVCQDWGGLLGLTIPPAMPERFKRLLVMNTFIATGASAGPGFEQWRAYSRSQPDMDIAALLARAIPELSPAEAAAYAAPYPDRRYKAGVRRFPDMVMTDPGMEGVAESVAARRWWKEQWQGQSFMAIGMTDPVISPDAMRKLHSMIAGCPEPLELAHAGHFVQESGNIVAHAALAAFATK